MAPMLSARDVILSPFVRLLVLLVGLSSCCGPAFAFTASGFKGRPQLRMPLRSQTSSSTEQNQGMLSGVGHAFREREQGEEVGQAERKVWEWRNDLEVSYVQRGTQGPPLLLVPGFGVGSFHYERNLERLSKTHRVWAVDLLGQGKSWPKVMPSEDQRLAFSVDTWREQLHAFVTEVIGEPAYIAGNSLGGFLGTGLAALHGDCVKGLILLNATPFWAFMPNRKHLPAWAAPLIPWDGALPAPEPMYKIGAAYFDALRNPTTITTMLDAVYANPSAYDEGLVRQILEPTNHWLGHATFSSILAAPKPELSFEQYLERVRCPILQIYGKEDPWVTPMWGQRIKRQKPHPNEVVYYELSPVGHCPHHEAPQAVNSLMAAWIEAQETRLAKDWDTHLHFKEDVTGATITATLQDGQPRDTVEWLLASLMP